ncbi:hypothetical protein FRB94_008668 [Tulasnella sp. JGI-2019a]|nr:hypothetical protein FRB94_008668 [Tulasnella sp. JGI-2019a]
MPKNVPLANVKTYPTAGATPGNANFVAEFEAAFPSPANPTGYQNWNVNLANTLDAVPQAWCTSSTAAPSQNLHRLPEFYDGTPACQAEVFILIMIMASRAKKSGLGYRPIKTSFFTGSSAALPVQKPKRLTDLSDPDIWDPKEPCWLTDAHFAHTSQYWTYMGMEPPSVNLQMDVEVPEDVTVKSELELAASWPVLRDIARGASDPRVNAVTALATYTEASEGDLSAREQ